MLVGCGRDLNRPGLVECAASLDWPWPQGVLGTPKVSCQPPPRPLPPGQWHSLASIGFAWAVVISRSLNIACVLWIVVRNLDFPPTPFFSIPNLAGRTRDCFCRLLAGGSDVMWCPQPEGWGRGLCGCLCFELSPRLCIPVANIWQ